MKLRLTRQATQDISDIADYIRERNPRAALQVRASIVEALQLLMLFPKIGRRQSIEHVRKLVARRYPYLIYYSIDESTEEIVVLSIRHPAQARDHTDA